MKRVAFGASCVLLACGMSACAGAERSPPAGPHLVEHGGALYIDPMPPNLPRGAFVYVLDPTPISSTTRVKVGMVLVLSPVEQTATWHCKPSTDVAARLAGGPFPVEPVPPQQVWQVGGCGSSFREQPDACQRLPDTRCDPALRFLRIELGKAEGVRTNDRYAVLGELTADPDTRGLRFETLGKCTVVAVNALDAVCVLHVDDWPAYAKSGRTYGHVLREQ